MHASQNGFQGKKLAQFAVKLRLEEGKKNMWMDQLKLL
jgi:hypothetical protein